MMSRTNEQQMRNERPAAQQCSVNAEAISEGHIELRRSVMTSYTTRLKISGCITVLYGTERDTCSVIEFV